MPLATVVTCPPEAGSPRGSPFSWSESRWLGSDGNNLNSTEGNDDWLESFKGKQCSLRVWINSVCVCVFSKLLGEPAISRNGDIFINPGRLCSNHAEHSSMILKSDPLRACCTNTFLTRCLSFPPKWIFSFLFQFCFGHIKHIAQTIQIHTLIKLQVTLDDGLPGSKQWRLNV